MAVECTHCGNSLDDTCDEVVYVGTEPYCDDYCLINENRNRFVNAQEENSAHRREVTGAKW